MAITGDKARAMFDRYNIVDERDLRDTVAKTDAYVAHARRLVVPALVGAGVLLSGCGSEREQTQNEHNSPRGTPTR